ncbi:hypothetical protein SAMN05192534_11054 [Alteribacillus persepolensis]|uniref:Helix-turn-helix domain-containing protein n=1 Tax=Alteribacillus persepolensis TaxID=568899 RepID=A0A1G8ESU7_9BACI|nr:hypothetical protein [Alteribacillus persepolensis]SDH72991.1 hypothetical protein SAMN05192534_11054 [Alteribacillus persepolensis]
MTAILSAVHHKAAKQHVAFASVKEMDHHLMLHHQTHRFTANEYLILRILSQHSLTYPGVSWLKLQTIAEKMHKSIRTVRRTVAALEKYYVIKRVPVMKKTNGGNTSNLLVILPAESAHGSGDRAQMSGRTNTTSRAETETLPKKRSSESVSLEKNIKQDNKRNISEQHFRTLIKLKWKDQTIRCGSAYMEKVVHTLLAEYEKREAAKRRLQKRRQSTKKTIPAYDWLNEINAADITERTTWLN